MGNSHSVGIPLSSTWKLIAGLAIYFLMCKGLTAWSAWHDFGSNEPSPSRRFVLPSACDISQYRAATTNSSKLKICPHCLHHRWSSFSLPAFVWPPMQFYERTKRVLLACVIVCVCVFMFQVFLCVWKWVSLDHMLMGVFGKNYWDNNCSCFFRAWPSHSYETISPLRNVKIIQGKSFTSQKRLIPSTPNSDIGSAPNVHPLFCCNKKHPVWMWMFLKHLI